VILSSAVPLEIPVNCTIANAKMVSLTFISPKVCRGSRHKLGVVQLFSLGGFAAVCFYAI
jgi:hypothetical protein